MRAMAVGIASAFSNQGAEAVARGMTAAIASYSCDAMNPLLTREALISLPSHHGVADVCAGTDAQHQ